MSLVIPLGSAAERFVACRVRAGSIPVLSVRELSFTPGSDPIPPSDALQIGRHLASLLPHDRAVYLAAASVAPVTPLKILHPTAPGTMGRLETVVRLLPGGQRVGGLDVSIVVVVEVGSISPPSFPGLPR